MSLRTLIEQKEKNKSHFVWNSIEFFVKDDIVPSKKSSQIFSINTALREIGAKIPDHLLSFVDAVYIGDFDFLNKKKVQAMYQDSSIYITNVQDGIDDFCDDLIHEIAHSVEDNKKLVLFSDGFIESEFLEKRKKLYLILKNEGYETELFYFQNPDFTSELDSFLYNDVGYAALDMFSASVFYSPYAITSLREYFANGFEAFFYYKDTEFLRKSCPKLYEKLYNLFEDYDDYATKENDDDRGDV